MMNSTYAPNSQPRIPTRVCQGHVVTTNLPTLGTNPNSKQHGSGKTGWSAMTGRTVRDGLADGLRDLDGRSANANRTSSTAP
jgi:hypothetical protein